MPALPPNFMLDWQWGNQMLFIFYIIISCFSIYFLYQFGVAIFNAVKIQIKEANELERIYGHDIKAAAKHVFLGKWIF